MKTELNPAELTAKFKALADPNRVRILELLKRPSCCAVGKPEGLCACDIEGQMDLSQPTISHHMKVLREAGLVEASKVGPWMWYRRNESAIAELAEAIRNAL
jgi:ArsR family transcriptional regulator